MRRPRPRVGLYLRTLAVLVVGLTSAFFKRRYRHVDRMPPDGPVIFAINHVSYADPFVVARFVWDAGRVPRYLAKASLFRLPVAGWIIGKAGQIPVERGTRDAAQSLGAAADALRSGELIAVYPEGTVTRDPDFWPGPAKTGAARLALMVPDAVVVPAGQWGAQYSVDVYHKRYRPFPRKTVTISVGPPVDLSQWRGSAPTAQTLRAMTDTIMAAVREQVAEVRS